MRVCTSEHWPDLVMVGRIISNVRSVPVGRKLTSMEVFVSVFWTPFANARHFPPPSEAGESPGLMTWGGSCGDGGGGG